MLSNHNSKHLHIIIIENIFKTFTELAALTLVNHVISEMDSCNIPTNIYIDLSKAFETLNYDILLNMLDYYDVQGCANRLIYSYLSERW